MTTVMDVVPTIAAIGLFWVCPLLLFLWNQSCKNAIVNHSHKKSEAKVVDFIDCPGPDIEDLANAAVSERNSIPEPFTLLSL